ncbi:uncharacterized protein BDW43DRAFT_305919 [Aspergillus alliaceus]|uniref:uncharacterized protein n=1 Tax=Petromyces alliaceus TaxID=209559 RepID=UPI0012A7534F|nr:uncharacterized protein BDW43DRAFT_305919 [Aspergillus alliaceus]KAB8239034.1 hypothetical protein BDW43DRAFT_305919 [Aspergillus alliaceus]
MKAKGRLNAPFSLSRKSDNPSVSIPFTVAHDPASLRRPTNLYSTSCCNMVNICGVWLWLAFACKYTFAQIQTFTPLGQNAITYSVNTPPSTSASGSGHIFIQTKSTREVRWFAVGQGIGMRGTNIFVVYTTGRNITVSPLLGAQHVETLYNLRARISVLSGSGIKNVVITANIRCDTCITWPGGKEDVTSPSSPWIWAVKYGPVLNSTSPSAVISMHDDFGLVSVNLKQATSGSSKNPFLNSSDMPTSSSAQAASTVSSQSTNKKRITHAVIMILVFVILFPLFTLGVPLFRSSRTVPIHACLQLSTLALRRRGLYNLIKQRKSDICTVQRPS